MKILAIILVMQTFGLAMKLQEETTSGTSEEKIYRRNGEGPVSSRFLQNQTDEKTTKLLTLLETSSHSLRDLHPRTVVPNESEEENNTQNNNSEFESTVMSSLTSTRKTSHTKTQFHQGYTDIISGSTKFVSAQVNTDTSERSTTPITYETESLTSTLNNSETIIDSTITGETEEATSATPIQFHKDELTGSTLIDRILRAETFTIQEHRHTSESSSTTPVKNNIPCKTLDKTTMDTSGLFQSQTEEETKATFPYKLETTHISLKGLRPTVILRIKNKGLKLRELFNKADEVTVIPTLISETEARIVPVHTDTTPITYETTEYLPCTSNDSGITLDSSELFQNQTDSTRVFETTPINLRDLLPTGNGNLHETERNETGSQKSKNDVTAVTPNPLNISIGGTDEATPDSQFNQYYTDLTPDINSTVRMPLVSSSTVLNNLTKETITVENSTKQIFVIVDESLRYYIITGAACFTTLVVIGIILLFFKHKKQRHSINLADIPHLNLRMEKYDITPIPRISTITNYKNANAIANRQNLLEKPPNTSRDEVLYSHEMQAFRNIRMLQNSSYEFDYEDRIPRLKQTYTKE